MSERRELPIFPLPLVLFPGQLLPLHIFEERYKLLVKDIMGSDKLFGINFIEPEPGRSESELAYSVGCTAEISLAVPLEEGRINIAVLGRHRYRILRYTHTMPYHIADIEIFHDQEDSSASFEELLQETKTVFEEFIETAKKLNEALILDGGIPIQSEPFSLLISSILPVSNQVKQQMLETTSTRQRLELALAYLREAKKASDHRLLVQNISKTNGHAGKSPIDN